MALKYSCFISYRSPCAEDARILYSKLSKELARWINLPIYLDEKRIVGGDLLERNLALALCESACMIMIYAPCYFDENYTYCAREYKAMENLEAERHQILKRDKNEKPGLIIPVIYRGSEHFPKQIKSLRRCYDFESISMYKKRYFECIEYQVAIRKISEYIYLRCNELSTTDDDLHGGCGMFELPGSDEIVPWLRNMISPKQPFPMRRAQKL